MIRALKPNELKTFFATRRSKSAGHPGIGSWPCGVRAVSAARPPGREDRRLSTHVVLARGRPGGRAASFVYRLGTWRCVMVSRVAYRVLAIVVLLAWAEVASAQTWTAEQLEVLKFEELQWQMSKDRDVSWIEKMVHPSLSYWETGQPVPQNKASLSRWNRYSNVTDTVLEQELFPISITITGNVAVVQYHYQVARENYKKDRATVQGHYTDVLVKEGGRWLFVAWSGGDDPKK
jgi:hypothetical protein